MNIPKDLNKIFENHKNTELLLCHDKAFNIVFEDENTIERLNSEMEINKYAPGFTAFATDGGNEVYAYNNNGEIFMIPIIGMSIKDAWIIAKNWAEFHQIIKKSAQQGVAPEPVTHQ